MKKKNIIIITSIFSALFILYNYIITNHNDNYRNLSSTYSNFTLNSTFIHEVYQSFKCDSSFSFRSLPESSPRNEVIKKYKTLFQQNTKLIEIIEDIFSGNSGITEDLIFQIIKIILPIVIFFGVVLIGWFTYCSCCCYDYCPIICTRKNKEVPYTYSERYVPVIIVLFSAASLLVPVVISFLNFTNVINAFTFSFCKLLSGNYKLKTGNDLEEKVEKDDEWIGYLNNENYFEDLKTNLLDQISKYGKLKKNFDNLINTINTKIAEVTDYLIHRQNFSVPNFPNTYLNSTDLIQRFKDEIPQFFQNFNEKHYKTFMTVDSSFFDEFISITNEKSLYSDLFDKIKEKYESNKEFNEILSEFLNYYYYILHDLNPLLITFQVILITSQTIVFIFNIVFSVLIFYFSKGRKKYVGHASWCLSSLNIVIMASVMILFYSLGTLLMNIGALLEKNAYLNTTSFIEKQTQTNITWLECLNAYNEEIEDYYYASYKEQIKHLKSLSLSLLKYDIFYQSDPFEEDVVLNYIRDLLAEATDPEKTFESQKDENKVPCFLGLYKIINSITNFRSSTPLMILNRCNPPLSFEIYHDKKNCTFSFINSLPRKDLSKIKMGEICFDINSVTPFLSSLFKTEIENCPNTERFYTSTSSTLYGDFDKAIQIAQNYFNQFVTYSNDVTSKLNEIAEEYKIINTKLKEHITDVHDNIIVPLNSSLRFPLSQKTKNFLSTPFFYSYLLLSSDNDSLISNNFMSFVSCSFFHNVTIDILNTIQYEISSALYTVIIAYIFLLTYNALSAVGGLIATFINFSPVTKIEDMEDEDEDDDAFEYDIASGQSETNSIMSKKTN